VSTVRLPVELAGTERHPRERHRRGLRHPDGTPVLVHSRIPGGVPPEPAYGDVLRAA